MYSDRQILANNVDPDQKPQTEEVASDQDLHCLPLIQQFYTYSQAVKRTCWKK